MHRNADQIQSPAGLPPARLKHAHYLVLAFSLILTFGVWNYSTTLGEQKARANFDRAAHQILELTTERMQRYEDGLWAGVGALNISGGHTTVADWRTFARTLEIDVKYPGINGIGVIFSIPKTEVREFTLRQHIDRPDFYIHPPHDRELSLPITFIEPEEPNRKAIGLDVAFEFNRFNGLMAARDSGEATITGPIALVQDEGSAPGFLFYAPIYKKGAKSSLSDRRDSFVGVVYAPFVVKNLMAGVLDRSKRSVWVTISDGSEVIYDEHEESDPSIDSYPMFSRTVDLKMYGRNWTMTLSTDAAFRGANEQIQPRIILICGLTIDALLLLLFSSMARTNRRVFDYANKVTKDLRREKKDLLESNAALEQFSYVASHDLKTPIRSMRDTIDYLKEDLQEVHPQTLSDKRIGPYFTTLSQLLDRMEALVKGVLECAQIPQKVENLSPLDPREAILEIARSIPLESDQLTLEGCFPPVLIPPKIFYQMFRNLLENAAFHFTGHEALRIIVTSRMVGFDLELTISDNGPGIEPRYHERIFEMFQSLNTSALANSTGIGLTIVRKAAHAVGGTVSIVSENGKGASFIVRLPNVLARSSSQIAAE